MKIRRIVKRLAAVGTGAVMLGATAMSALALDLKEYPSQFVTDGVFNGFLVVGENAAAIDNLAMTDIAASMKYSKPGDAKTTTVSGDAWLVGTSSKKFETANSNTTDSSINGEQVRDITTFISDDELKALTDSKWATNEQSYDYQQFLFFDEEGYAGGARSRIVKYTEDDADKTGYFFFIGNNRQIARYRMEFSSTAQSDVTDSAGSADTTGTYLDDFENTQLSMFGQTYTVVLARRPDTVADQSIRLVLMAGSARDTLLEGETKSYTVKDKVYDVSVTFIDSDEAKFTVNGEATNKLKVGETYVLADKSEVGVSEILYQDYAGGIHSATFFVGAQKMELRDDQVTDATGAYGVKIGSESIDGTTVIVVGTDNNTTFSVSTIDVNMTGQDDYFVGPGAKLSDVIAAAGEEKEAVFTNNWDIEYKGLTEEKTRDIGLKTSSSRRYKLRLFDGDGNQVDVPVAYAENQYNISMGEETQLGGATRANQKRLVLRENGEAANGAENAPLYAVYKDDYFITTGGTASDGSAKSYLLTYQGSDRQTKTSPKIRFKNKGSGETLEYSVSTLTTTGTVATIKLGGYSFVVQNGSSTLLDDFALNIDYTGEGSIDGTNVTFVDNYGTQWTILETPMNGTLQGPDNFRIDQTTPNADDYDNVVPSTVTMNITASSDPEVRLAVTGVTLKTPDGKTEVSYGYTSMGTFITLQSPSSDPQELTLQYPEKQRLPQVYVTSGVTTATSTAGGTLTPVTIVDATKLDSEIANVKAQNLIAVGGPCVNTVAAELLGNPAVCTEGFTPGKARIKLFQNGDKVAMLVAGYTGADTRLAGQFVAYRASELFGEEVEVEGTTRADATVSAPSVVSSE